MENKWISVKESQPEYSKRVLVLFEYSEDPYIGYRKLTDVAGDSYILEGWANDKRDINYWMELPNTPE